METKKNKAKYAQCLSEELHKYDCYILKELCKSFILKSTTVSYPSTFQLIH